MIPIPYGETRLCTVTSRMPKVVTCESCHRPYAYIAVRAAQGSGANILWLNKEQADKAALQGAQAEVQRRLDGAIEAVPCPRCGWYQSSMLAVARHQHLLLWHWIGLFTALFALPCILVVWTALKYFPEWHPGPVLFRITMVAFFGGLLMVGGRFVLSWRFKPNQLALERRLQFGRTYAIPLSDDQSDGLRLPTKPTKPEKFIPITEVPKAAAASQELLMAQAAQRGPKRPLLYAFQFVALPEAAFQNHPDLIKELEGGPSTPALLHFWSKAEVRCISQGMMDPTASESDADWEARKAMFTAVAVHPHKRNGYTAYVVTMPPPESPPEAHFVAIVHKDGEPREFMQESPATRYFTLEKSLGNNPVLCECLPDSSHQNYGPGPAPDIGSFVEAVFKNIERQKA